MFRKRNLVMGLLLRANRCNVRALISRKLSVSTLSKPALMGSDKADMVRKETTGMFSLAGELASLVEESSHVDDDDNDGSSKPRSRMELKRSLELRLKKRVKELYTNGKFTDLLEKVIARPETLQDAYDCIRLNSNVSIAKRNGVVVAFDSIAQELSSGAFDVALNTFSLAARDKTKEVLVMPTVALRVVQEAIRIVLEVVFSPHFSKISHSCRSGRGRASALKYISNNISRSDWCFTLSLNKKLDVSVFEKLLSVMEEKLEDGRLSILLRAMFEARVLNLEFGGFPKGHGLPQEGVLSRVLMNIYLDRFDHEFYRISMRHEALHLDSQTGEDSLASKLRSWFRRQAGESTPDQDITVRVYCCRYMDEIFFSVSGPKKAAVDIRSEAVSFLRNSLHLDITDETDTSSSPCEAKSGLRVLGTLVRKYVRESPSVKAVHKLKEKVKLFALQKEEAWTLGTVRIGKKWLGHGLKRVKESEIKGLADKTSTLSQISRYRKAGMETDHWYKVLLRIWMEDVVRTSADRSEEFILSKHVAEPTLPRELRDAFHKFQNSAAAYVSSETANLEAISPCPRSQPVFFGEFVAPTNAIQRRLLRYGLITAKGYARSNSMLVLQDTSQIIDWFSGLVRRWVIWYGGCSNFDEVKALIDNQVRKSCIRTLAAKYRIHEDEIEKRLDLELSTIPYAEDIELEVQREKLDSPAFDKDEHLTYGISNSGLSLLSLARLVSDARPCNCFVIGCSVAAPAVYTLHAMERQKFPGWRTGFSVCIHPSLNGRRVGLCKQHLKDLYIGHISLQAIDFGAWR